MILLDTCVLVFDALAPERLSTEALRAIEEGEENGSLACCDISLWEIAMLVSQGATGSRHGCSFFSEARFSVPGNPAAANRIRTRRCLFI